MRVIGIDPNSHGFHAAIVNIEDGEEDEVVLRQFKTRASEYRLWSGVLAFINQKATEVLTGIGLNDAAVFIEEPLVAGARNLRSSLKLAQAVGALVAGATEYTDHVYLIPVSTWKKGVVGTGNASKDEVALWLNRVYPNYAAQCDGSQDFIDACCIARYGIGVVTDAEALRTVGSLGEL